MALVCTCKVFLAATPIGIFFQASSRSVHLKQGVETAKMAGASGEDENDEESKAQIPRAQEMGGSCGKDLDTGKA